jgi:hypothetical protein
VVAVDHCSAVGVDHNWYGDPVLGNVGLERGVFGI